MASQLTAKAANAAKYAAMGFKDAKVAQLGEKMVAPDESSRITSDYGVRQNNTDDWLRIVSENHTGPALLEDPFGREKASGVPRLAAFVLKTNRPLPDPPLRP